MSSLDLIEFPADDLGRAQRFWEGLLGVSLQERFAFLMRQLKIENTAAAVAHSVSAPHLPIDRAAEIVAAGGTITAAERKAEGLAD